MSEKLEYKTVRIERPAWLKLKKASVDYDFGVGELLTWFLLDMEQIELNDYAKDMDSKIEFEECEKDKMSKEAEIEDEDESEDEDEEEEEEAA